MNRQGAGRVGSVSRASAQAIAPAPVPSPEPVPRVEPAPRAAAAPESSPEPSEAIAPARMLGDAPAPASPPRNAERVPPAPPVEPEAREFVGPDGTRMYGVPNLENDLNESLMQVRESYAELTKRRDQSIEEMEKLFDDYDNF